MRNYQKIMKKVSDCLKPDGKTICTYFYHKEYAYKFEGVTKVIGMSKYFFTGGIMPSDDLLLYFNEQLSIQQHWHVSGMHYSKTSEHVRNMDKHKSEIIHYLKKHMGKNQAVKWWVYWRIFYMACAELWGYNNG